MTASFRLAIATEGFRGGLAGSGISQTIYVDSSISTEVVYPSLNVNVEMVQAIGVEYGPIEVEVEIEGCY